MAISGTLITRMIAGGSSKGAIRSEGATREKKLVEKTRKVSEKIPSDTKKRVAKRCTLLKSWSSLDFGKFMMLIHKIVPFGNTKKCSPIVESSRAPNAKKMDNDKGRSAKKTSKVAMKTIRKPHKKSRSLLCSLGFSTLAQLRMVKACQLVAAASLMLLPVLSAEQCSNGETFRVDHGDNYYSATLPRCPTGVLQVVEQDIGLPSIPQIRNNTLRYNNFKTSTLFSPFSSSMPDVGGFLNAMRTLCWDACRVSQPCLTSGGNFVIQLIVKAAGYAGQPCNDITPSTGDAISICYTMNGLPLGAQQTTLSTFESLIDS